MEAGEEHFDLVEVMTCTTGCVGGAGQPIGRREQKYARAEGLYEADRKTLIKSSQHNPILKALYEKLTPERAHELLHVYYPQPGITFRSHPIQEKLPQCGRLFYNLKRAAG